MNGDPALRPRPRASAGPEQAEALAHQLAAVAIDLCVVSEFPRAQQTADLALGGRDVPRMVDPGLNDVRIGELEGKTLDDYRDWKHGDTRATTRSPAARA